jgi:glycogen debranching enzyme
MEELSVRFGEKESPKRYQSLASATQRTFNHVFWNSQENCLYDVVSDSGPDASVRPNQIFAVSLRHSMMQWQRQANVLSTVEQRLLTPCGLRTLSPDNPNYKGRYEGDTYHRDAAYHQGTVWPWLLGPFISAYCRVHGSSDSSREHVRELLRPIEECLRDGALGQIAEIYDGDEPQRPRGCFAQAWSVAEVLRVIFEDVYPAKKKQMQAPAIATSARN